MKPIPVIALAGLLAACVTPLPTATPEELDDAAARVLDTSLQLRGLVLACADAGDDIALQALSSEARWRERHRALLLNAGGQYARALSVQAEPYGVEKTALPAVKLRHELQRAGRERVTATARDSAGVARNCSYELDQFDNGVRDLLPQAAQLPGLHVLALSPPADAGDDLDIPVAGRAFMLRYRIGTSLAQVDKTLLAKRCPRAATLLIEETEAREVHVALCENGRRYVVRCEFRNCVAE